jgi:protoporphyrinogen oxidase
MKPTVIIIGGGPAGLTAALELVRDGRMQPIVLEAGDDVGGLSRTVEYKGNRMDIGGHRFFSKSDWVMNWWREILPIAADQAEVSIAYHGRQRKVGADSTAMPGDGRALLVRRRLSRIYFLRRFFDYPIALNANTLQNLGPLRLLRIGASYLAAAIFPRRPERSLEDFLVNRFGVELYRTFFKDYTEKVWGVPCGEIRRNGAPSGSRGCRCARPCATPWRACSEKELATKRHATPAWSSSSSTRGSGRARCGGKSRAAW